MLYTFGSAPGSSLPQAPLTELNGVLYGMKVSGGAHDFGTDSGRVHGYYPRGLVAVNGRLDGAATLGRAGSTRAPRVLSPWTSRAGGEGKRDEFGNADERRAARGRR